MRPMRTYEEDCPATNTGRFANDSVRQRMKSIRQRRMSVRQRG